WRYTVSAMPGPLLPTLRAASQSLDCIPLRVLERHDRNVIIAFCCTGRLVAFPMLSRRHLLLGSTCSLAMTATCTRADDGLDMTVRQAGKAGCTGAVLGRVIRARRGDEVKVRLVNGLDEPMALCWHGVRLPNAIDNAPPAAPGASIDYRFVVPDGGTF